jgi:hypothetical protein
MNNPRLFLVEKPMTRLQVLLEQRQAIEDAIYALQQYRLLNQLFEPPSGAESACERDPGPKQQMTH